MPWLADAYAHGFTSGVPWLPFGPDHGAAAIDRQEIDPRSILQLTRRLIALRGENDALMQGNVTIIEAHQNLLAFTRESDRQTLLCLFNLGDDATVWQPPQPERWRVIEAVGGATSWNLPGYSGLIVERIG
jgi:alpha-glucosidase